MNSSESQSIFLFLLYRLLRPETVVIRRHMKNGLDHYDGQMVPGGKCGLNFLTVEGKPKKKPQPGN